MCEYEQKVRLRSVQANSRTSTRPGGMLTPAIREAAMGRKRRMGLCCSRLGGCHRVFGAVPHRPPLVAVIGWNANPRDPCDRRGNDGNHRA